MPNCSCGATPPEDARFCHRCGKPLRDEPVIAEFAPAPTVRAELNRPAALAPGPKVTFSDPLALRSCLLVASITTLFTILPFTVFVSPLIGGFASVALYHRRSGLPLNLGDGAKLGWITGVISSLLLTIFTTLTIAVNGANFEAFRQQVRTQMGNPAAQQVVDQPWFLISVVLICWVLGFAFVSFMSILGGAIGARSRKLKA